MNRENLYLKGSQARELRGQGHHLKPTVMVGREGVTPAVLEALEAVLTAHELVKIKVQEGCPAVADEVAEKLAAACGAAIAQLIGRMILLYRENPTEAAEPAKQRPARAGKRSPSPKPPTKGRSAAATRSRRGGDEADKAAGGRRGSGGGKRTGGRSGGRGRDSTGPKIRSISKQR